MKDENKGLIPQPNSEQKKSDFDMDDVPYGGPGASEYNKKLYAQEVEGAEVSEPIKDAIKEVFPNANMVIMGPIGDPIYQNWLKFPPKFYCANYSNADLPPLYCTKQCMYCLPDNQRKPIRAIGVDEKKEPDYDRDQFLNERDSVSKKKEPETACPDCGSTKLIKKGPHHFACKDCEQIFETGGSVPTPGDERKYLETSLKTFMMIRDMKIPGMDLETPIAKLEAFLLRGSTQQEKFRAKFTDHCAVKPKVGKEGDKG